MMKSFLIVVLLLLSGSMYSQKTTRFTPFLNSNWSNSLNWSNGKPSADDTAIIQVFISDNCRINEDAEIHDLYNEDGGTITIESGNTLTVNGDLHLSNNSSIINNGKLDIKGSIYKDGFSRLQVFSSINLEGSISFD